MNEKIFNRIGSRVEQGKKAGDSVYKIATNYAERINNTEFVTRLREGKLSVEEYRQFISRMYPIVVGFNGALIRNLSRVDHVRNSSLVRGIAEQLQEEQGHNDLYREMLTAHGIDHGSLYQSLEEYRNQFSQAQLDQMTEDFLRGLERGQAPSGIFRNAPVPEAVVALEHYLRMTSGNQNGNFWEHFSSQSAIEQLIYNAVSKSVYPGVVNRSDLNLGPKSIAWWKEHSRQGGAEETGQRSDEEKHLEISKLLIDRNVKDPDLADKIQRTVKNTMELFEAIVTDLEVKQI